MLIRATKRHGRPPLYEIYGDLILARLMPSGAVHTNRRLFTEGYLQKAIYRRLFTESYLQKAIYRRLFTEGYLHDFEHAARIAQEHCSAQMRA